MRGLRLVIGVLVVIAAAVWVRPAAADDQAVSISNAAVPGQYQFSPATKTVEVGDRVTWTNETAATHTVTSDTTGPLDSPNISPGESYSHTFVKSGTFAYHCEIHSNMHGTIIVSEATTTTLAPATTTTLRPTTTRPATTTSRATTSTSTFTTETLALETTVPGETTTTAGQVALKSNKGGSNGAAVAILVLSIGAILGGGGYLLYRLRTGRF